MPRLLAHAVFGTRRYMERRIGALARDCRGLRVLELGSGKRTRGGHSYSVKEMFDPSNDFIQSDVVADYGHPLVDVTTMGFKEEFDLVLCLNILEHVYDFATAVRNVHRAVRPGGRAVFVVPGFYPLHDEPSDFWRFTEHGLRRLLADFSHVLIDHHGPRRYPFAYLAVVKK